MSYKIIGKYIKDLSFSIPNPKTFLLLSKDISNYKINIDIKSNQVKEKIIDVQTTLNLSPIKNNFDKINTKIVYSTIIELTDGITPLWICQIGLLYFSIESILSNFFK